MSRKRTTVWISTIIALLAGLMLRLVFVRLYANIQGDTLLYGDIAQNWLLHGVYGQTGANGAQATLIRLPGYPLFLATCFRLFGMENYYAVLYVQCVADLLSCCLMAGLAARLFGGRAGMIALWLAALCPYTANYVAAPLTETLSVFAVSLALYCLLRCCQDPTIRAGKYLYVLTFSLALSVLLRPDGGLLATALVPCLFWFAWRRATLASQSRMHAIALTLLVCAGTVLPLAPWTIRNWETFHVVQPLAPKYANDPNERVNYGFNRWYRSWAVDFASTENVYWNYNGAPIKITDLPSRAFDSRSQYDRTSTLLDDYNHTSKPTPELDARFAALAQERVSAHPLRSYVELPFARLANMALRPRVEMLPVSLEWWRFRQHKSQTVFAWLYGMGNLLYLALAAAGFWMVRKSREPIVRLMLVAMAAYVLLRCLLLLTIDNSEPRYTLECFPIVIVLAAAALSRTRKVIRHKT